MKKSLGILALAVIAILALWNVSYSDGMNNMNSTGNAAVVSSSASSMNNGTSASGACSINFSSQKKLSAGNSVVVTAGTQTTCPVMKGNSISKNKYFDYKGKRIYTCCGYCISQIKKNPQKYINMMEKNGVVLATVKKAGKKQETCPIMGGKINKNLYVDYKGKRIYTCCQACIQTVKKDPQKYIDMLEKNGIELDKAN